MGIHQKRQAYQQARQELRLAYLRAKRAKLALAQQVRMARTDDQDLRDAQQVSALFRGSILSKFRSTLQFVKQKHNTPNLVGYLANNRWHDPSRRAPAIALEAEMARVRNLSNALGVYPLKNGIHPLLMKITRQIKNRIDVTDEVNLLDALAKAAWAAKAVEATIAAWNSDQGI